MTLELRGMVPTEGEGALVCGPYACFILQLLLAAHLFVTASSSHGAYKTASTTMDAFA